MLGVGKLKAALAKAGELRFCCRWTYVRPFRAPSKSIVDWEPTHAMLTQYTRFDNIQSSGLEHPLLHLEGGDNAAQIIIRTTGSSTRS